jgi:hypothetical protein
MNIKKTAVTLSLLGCLASIGFSQVTKTSGGYLFRYKFVKGRVYAYTITSSVAIPSSPKPMTINGPFVETVNGVKGTDGQITVVFGPLTTGSKPAVAKTTRSFTETNRGGVADAADVQQMFMQLPEGPKKPGDTWTGETSVAAMGSDSKVKAKYKFLGMTAVHGRPAARVAMTMTTTGQANTSGTGILIVLVEDGSLWSTETHLVLTGAKASSKPIKISMMMTRH